MHAMEHLLDAVVWAVATTTTLYGARPTHARKAATYNISRTLLMMSCTRGVLGGGASDAAAPGGTVQGTATWTAK